MLHTTGKRIRPGPVDALQIRLRDALHRGVDLERLAGIVRVAAPADIESLVRLKPTGVFERRLWFLYEWLTGETLDLPVPAGRLRFVPVLDPDCQVALDVGLPSGRHRVIDNLPGTPRFCPMVRWTPALRAASAKQWDARVRRIVASTPADRRDAIVSCLQRSEAESSFALTGRKPSDPRAVRWADAIGHAGARVLTPDELLRLQRVVCAGAPAVHLGLRAVAATSSGVEGRLRGQAGARAEDVESLVGGLIDFAERAVRGGVDPVIAAAALAFAFRNVRPLVSGNGCLHRWLVHYTFDATGYTPPGFVLPISTAMHRRLDEYRDVSSRSQSESPDAYRFADMTQAAEFLYICLEDCVERDLGEVDVISGLKAGAT